MDKERWVWVFGWVLLDSFLKRLRLLLRRGARHNKLCEESDVYPHLVFQRGGAQEVSIPLSFALLPHFSFRMQCPKQVHKTQKVFGRRVIRARHLQPFFKLSTQDENARRQKTLAKLLCQCHSPPFRESFWTVSPRAHRVAFQQRITFGFESVVVVAVTMDHGDTQTI